MLLYEGLTRVHLQKKPRVHFGKSFALEILSGTEQGQQNICVAVIS